MENQQLIQKYLNQQLSKQEKLQFENLLKNNTAFKAEVAFHSNLKKVVTHEDDATFRTLINTLEQQKSQGSSTYMMKWIVAASMVLLFGLSFFLTSKQTSSSNDLFLAYFEPYKNVIAPIVRGENNNQDKKEIAFTMYEKGNYQKAVILFSELYNTTKEPYYLFYKANALLKLDRAKEAIPLLINHLKTKDTLTQKTNWYLALAYLKIKDQQKAKETLKKVIENHTYKSKEAKKLLEKVN